MAKVEDCPGFETFGADVKAAREAKQNNQTTTSNFPCNFNFTVSNMNRFNQSIDHS